MNCPNCGHPVPPGAQFCGNCGTLLQAAPAAPVNPVPGVNPVPQPTAPPASAQPAGGFAPPAVPPGVPQPPGGAYISQESDKNYMTAFLFALFLGTFGIDRFYMGEVGTGVLKLLTLGGCGLWSLIDTVLLVAGVRRDKFGRELAGRQKNFQFSIIVFIAVFLISSASNLLYFGLASHSVANRRPPINSATGTSRSGTSAASSSSSSPSSSSSAPLAVGEQLSKPPNRRPAQYLHQCNDSSQVVYVAKSTCLPGDTFQLDYDPSVAGTVYSTPCETTSGATRRYVYISSDESCPNGTASVSLGNARSLLGHSVALSGRQPVSVYAAATD